MKAILCGSLRPGPEGCDLEMLTGLVLYITQVVTLRSATEGHTQCLSYKIEEGEIISKASGNTSFPASFPTDQSYLQCAK